MLLRAAAELDAEGFADSVELCLHFRLRFEQGDEVAEEGDARRGVSEAALGGARGAEAFS